LKLQESVRIEITGKLREDISELFVNHNDSETLNHVLKVASVALRVATRFGVDSNKAEQAALLHDISNVIPVDRMLDIAIQLNVKVDEEEYKYPRIIHQKLSRAMAEQIFKVRDQEILNAIECHTTLKPNASQLDKVLFISDKISWEIPGDNKYLQHIREKVENNELLYSEKF